MMMRVLALEPFYGGSHRRFVEGLQRHSVHELIVLKRPDRHWKWRMRTFPVDILTELDRRLAENGPFDLIFASDYVDLAALVGLRPNSLADVPKILYMHENQLTYPVQKSCEQDRDCHFAMTNITSMLAADEVWFNSAWHRHDFFQAFRGFSARGPEKHLRQMVSPIFKKSRVVPLGLDLPPLGEGCGREQQDGLRHGERLGTISGNASGDDHENSGTRERPLRLLWNHRWEFDKGPDDLLQLAKFLQRDGLPHEWVICGASNTQRPEAFNTMADLFAKRIHHIGPVDDVGEYHRLMGSCDAVISTAIHDFFGCAVVEAVAAGCAAIVPRRLSYPEIFAEGGFFYDDLSEIPSMLRKLKAPSRRSMRALVQRFDWQEMGPIYDAAMSCVASQPPFRG